MLERTPVAKRDATARAVDAVPVAHAVPSHLVLDSVTGRSAAWRSQLLTTVGHLVAAWTARLSAIDVATRCAAGSVILAVVLASLIVSGDVSITAGVILLVVSAIAIAVVSGAAPWRPTRAPADAPVADQPTAQRRDLAPAGDAALADVGTAITSAATLPAVLPDRGQAILAAIPDAALVVDRTGLIVETNPLVPEMFPRGRPGLLVNQMCRSPEVVDAVERALVGGRVVVEIEEWVPVRRKLMMTVAAIGPATDIPPAPQPALLIVFRDVSEQEKLAQMRADFIANASHELRTPLASLRGFVETLQGPARDDAAARDRFLAIMATQANRMTRLIDDLLSLSRVEMRVHVPPTGTIDVTDVAHFVVQSMEPLAAGYGAQLMLISTDTPARIRGDRDELVQVVQNLVHNALKYGRPTGGRITVRIAREPAARDLGRSRGRVTLAVEDDGPGIAASHLPRLTERFYRVSPTVSRDRGGTGLGLAIVKNIVTRHRGELGIRSEMGRGSVFSVTFDELVDRPQVSGQAIAG